MVAFYRIGRIMKAKASRLFGKENLNDESNRYCKTGSVGSVCIDAADLLHFAGREGGSFDESSVSSESSQLMENSQPQESASENESEMVSETEPSPEATEEPVSTPKPTPKPTAKPTPVPTQEPLKTVNVTIPEGYTVPQIAELLEKRACALPASL